MSALHRLLVRAMQLREIWMDMFENELEWGVPEHSKMTSSWMRLLSVDTRTVHCVPWANSQQWIKSVVSSPSTPVLFRKHPADPEQSLPAHAEVPQMLVQEQLRVTSALLAGRVHASRLVISPRPYIQKSVSIAQAIVRNDSPM
jgi:hypothetical protein